MTHYLFENPILTLAIGGLTLAIIAGGWLQTQRRELLVAFTAALVAIVGLLVLEVLVVTDRERLEAQEDEVKATIHQIAREAEANDAPALARHFHSRASTMREQLLAEIQNFQVSNVSVKNNLKVVIDPTHSPPQATATFSCVATISDNTGILKDRPIPRFVTAYFELEDNAWRCTGYKHEDPQQGFKKRHEE